MTTDELFDYIDRNGIEWAVEKLVEEPADDPVLQEAFGHCLAAKEVWDGACALFNSLIEAKTGRKL